MWYLTPTEPVQLCVTKGAVEVANHLYHIFCEFGAKDKIKNIKDLYNVLLGMSYYFSLYRFYKCII